MDPTIKSMFQDEHAAEGAAHFGVSLRDLTFIGGFQNFIYSYTRDEQQYILRFTPSTLRSAEEVAAEIEWIRYLSDNGVSVTASVPSITGKDVEHIQGDPIDFFATSFEHASGKKIGYPECLGNPSLYEQCGRITGRLHERTKHYTPKVKRHTWESNHYLIRARDYLPAELQPVLDALDELKKELTKLPINADTYGLIHGDINVGNFTVDDSCRITLFDFDECQYSWYAEDIAIQLYYLLYVFGEDSKPERKVQFEQFMNYFELGYTADGRQMPDDWKDQLKLFLRLREIIVVVGMHRSWDLSQPDEWTRDFLRDSRMRISNRISLIDEL
ncbi:Ser/Thr protein kinase RdoA (MazF antagonist) [Paenibacillus taihuensis]|uniref:Ser/Thr protein kinase RdoA (MazF antagonist) n=1 Tax=Paenibacillus taihuensis TaxID=1156355 RepID=A0A3D9SFD3_9BACL|nr:phosphotransferase [Paenibacillus taihuensis]REE94616.1 Ser/Thr protein kinase RdoA (MazF antagonist) [Paenibacillus taihuensis]